MRLIETPRIVVRIDSGRLDDAKIEEIASKLEPELDRLSRWMNSVENRMKEILADERDLNGEKFEFSVSEED